MEETLQQVGGLLLGAVPTALLLLTVFAGYLVLVHRPLGRALEERYNRSAGALEKARADIAAAGARTTEYEQRLRDARLAIYKAQEARRQKALEARAAAVTQARERGDALIRQARATLEADAEAAKSVLQAESSRLADQVIQSVLKPAVAGGRQG
ncbi:MAG: ATP synthase F0 subunit B [Terriglobales bacterium]